MGIMGLVKKCTGWASSVLVQNDSDSAEKVTKLKLHSVGTDRFVIDIDSLYDSEGVKKQADAASKLDRGCM